MKPLTIVIPMAGEGSRFAAAGFADPKPFIDVAGQPMVARVLDNLSFPEAQFVLIARRSHVERAPGPVSRLEARGRVAFHLLDGLTEGTACTVLAARSLMPAEAPLLIANSDQLVDGGIGAMIADARARDLDGSIMVFRSPPDPKWSYAALDERGLVTRVAEKVPISEFATVGIYYFRNVGLFSTAAEAMIAANDRVNNEFYTCPTYNYAIGRGARIGIWEIPPSAMHGLGTPEDLKAYLGK
ncbi:MAG: glycosyltransferase family 2 protein [Alphaproteobacteria bacterium]